VERFMSVGNVTLHASSARARVITLSPLPCEFASFDDDN
jgi:hypothetical protein